MIDTLARLRSLRLVTLLSVAALTASCDEIGAPSFDDDGEEEGEVDLARTQLPLVKGRKVTISPWAVGAKDPSKPEVISLTSETDQMHPLLNRIRQQCRRDVFAGLKAALKPDYTGDCNFSATAFAQCDGNTDLPPGQLDGDGTGAVQSALYWNCMGNYALSIAEATTTYYVGTTGQAGATGGYGAISTKRWSVGAEHPGNAIQYTITPSSSSDRASWALLATDLFREALEAATIVAQHPNCSDAALTTTCKSTETGLQVPTSFMNSIAAQIPEAMANSVEAAEKATKYLHASAQTKRGSLSDSKLSRQTLWRHSYDSLLRAASAYVVIPDSLFNQEDANGSITTQGTYPIVTSVSQTDADRRAEELLRRHKIDPTRSITNVANDLLASLKVELPGALATWSSTAGLGYLLSIGIEQADFERAAKRLTQEAAVLGRPILAYTDANGVRHASGVEKVDSPVSPAYLYAITEGGTYSGRGEFDFTDGNLAIEYARGGIFHAMEYFVETSKAILARSGAFSARNRSLIDSAQAYAKQQVQGRIAVSTCDTACISQPELGPGIDRVWLSIVSVEESPITSTDQIAARSTLLAETYDIWLGEEGLACALTGEDRSDHACVAEAYKFNENVTASVGGYGSFDLSRAYGPTRDGGTVNPYAKDGAAVSPRVYITRVVTASDGATKRNELVAGLTLTAPTTGWGTFRMPISSGLSEALQNTLGVDPIKPDETAQLCGKGGLPRNQKVGLEDELLQSQGTNGSNTVEESWAYYLGLAKQAAEEADMIGSELVDRGLEMDMIAEDARAELEDQCGGTINIASIREGVCSAPHNCNLKKYLEDPANATNESLQQLKQCLGIEKPVDAVLGSNAVCAWQMEGLPPCMCPDPSTSTVATLQYSVCPGREIVQADLASGVSPTRMCPAVVPRGTEALKKTDGTAAPNGACEAIFPSPNLVAAQIINANSSFDSSNVLFPETVRFRTFKKTLGLVPRLSKSTATPDYSCSSIIASRAGSALPALENLISADPRLGWTAKSLGEVAQRLTVERDYLNFVNVGRDGVPWLSTGKGSSQDDPNPWLAKTTFPCAPLDPNLCQAGNESLSCSMSCGGVQNNGESTTSWDRRMIEGRLAVGERLARAVRLLRFIAGVPLDGIEVALTNQDAQRLAGRSFGFFSVGVEGQSEGRFLGKPWEYRGATGYRVSHEAKDSSFSELREVGKLEPRDGLVFTLSRRDQTAHWSNSLGDLNIPNASVGMLFADEGLLGFPSALPGLATQQYWATDIKRDIDLAFRAPFRDRRLKEAEIIPNPVDAKAFRRLAEGTALVRSSDWRLDHTYEDLADALELACLAANEPPSLAQNCENEGLTASIGIKGVADLARARGVVECRANQIRKATSALTLADVPASLVKQVSSGAVAGIYPTFGGQYAVTVNELYGALMRLSTHMLDLSEQIRSSGNALDLTRLQLQASKYKRQMEIENAAKEIGALSDQCSMATQQANLSAAASLAFAAGAATPSAGAPGGNPMQAAGHAIQAYAAIAGAQQQCSSANAQKAHVRAISALGAELAKTEQGIIIVQAADAMLKQQAAVERTWNGLKTAYGDAQAALAKLAAQRNAAYRAAAKMLMLDGDGAGHDYASNTAMRARLNTLRVKYERARDYAVRMTYLARRAIEQKIGMELSTLDQDVGWVPAPKKWADTICSLEGIDYKKISNARKQDGQEDATGKAYDYADQYVGDYVTRLQEFMTAYVNNYVSHDGDDVALVSVRDELLGLRTLNCDVYGQNELLQTAEAREVAAFGSDPEQQRKFEPSGVWEKTCNSSGLCVDAAAANPKDDDPLVPYGRDAMGNPVPAKTTDEAGNELALDSPLRVVPTDYVDFGALGDVVQAVKLRTEVETVSGGVGDPNARQQPPAAGMAYWYRADSCDPLRTTYACEDRSGWGRNSGRALGPTVTLIPAGIGGMPTLNFPKDSYITIATGLPVANEYTLVSVFRGNTLGSNYLWSSSHTTADGRPQALSVTTSDPWLLYGTSADTRQGGGPNQSVMVSGRLAPQQKPAAGDILVIRGGASGVDFFLNGNLRAHATAPAVASNLAGYIANTVGGPMQVAETIAYATRLSDVDMDALHAYLSGRYRIGLRPPIQHFEADFVQELRDNGASQGTGYQFSDGFVRDAATGLRAGEYSGDLDTSPMVPFAGDHVGLRFDVEHMSFPGASSISGVTGGVSWSSTEQSAAAEYAATGVVNLDLAGDPLHSIWAVSNPLHAAGDTRYLFLQVRCDTGSVGFLNTRLGSARMSAPGSVACGAPFVVSLRGSERSGTTDLFVNGERVLSDPSFDKAMYPTLGGRNGLYMRGLVADMQFHVNRMSDADVIALHNQLGTKYGIPTAGADDGSGAPATVDGRPVTTVPEYRQLVRLDGGTYLLSWYEPLRAAGDITQPYLTPFVRTPTGTDVTVTRGVAAGSPYEAGQDRWLAPGWARHWATFATSGEVYVGWQVPPSTGDLADGVLFAAPQLEEIEGGDLMSVGPSQFWPTDDDGLSPFGTCEDRGGVQMRSKDGAWSEGCEVYCPAGTGNDCTSTVSDPDLLPKRCFHELKFHISQEDIEKGKLIPQGGFAAGNFNYRWEEIGVNVVGTAIKNCENSELPSACYANNFLQYSLRHDGPFTVRNYLGRDYEAPIYSGRIQQSKALMAERYLTNPLSGADRSLLTDFWDYEFVGRPLEGNYTLRIYGTEKDGLDWDKVEDIQLLMHYRYWTRLN